MLKQKNTYIMNLKAKDIVYHMDELTRVYNPVYKYKDENGVEQEKSIPRYKLYSGSLPYSLDLIQLNKISPKEFKNNKSDDMQYSDAIINVTFSNSIHEYKEGTKYVLKKGRLKVQDKVKGKSISTILALRKDLYKNGFSVKINDTDIEYVMYKRSSSKARLGSHLFIKKDLYNDMILWSRMDMTFDEVNVDDIKSGKAKTTDIASLKAYESLTLSSIEGIIKIKPEEILLIDDVKGYYKCWASVTRLDENNQPVAKDEEIEINNLLWDGQSLGCSSLFPKDEDGKQKGMMLLRNRWFKSCAFNTNIQQYIKDYFKKLGTEPPEFIPDMFNRPITTSKIKIIITPSSLKLFKFAYKLSDEVEQFDRHKECYKYWLKHISWSFGVCKSEKPSHYGNCNRLSYQMINSLPLQKNDIGNVAGDRKTGYKYDGLMAEELKYIELLKNNVAVFRHHIDNYKPSPSSEFISNLLAVNDKVQQTSLYTDFRKKTIDNYIEGLRVGKIKIVNSDYATLMGNPIEMLEYAVSRQIAYRPHKGKQMYCPKYKDGVKLVAFRNPNITMGNVLVVDNVYNEDFNTYFNLTDNIVISNAYDTDTCDRLQSQDYDSDNCILNSLDTLVSVGVECEKFLTPINKIESTPKEQYYCVEDIATVDNVISQNLIGDIVNWSQILNSYYWKYYNANINGEHDKILKKIYDKVSVLSSLSQIEIDKAKKYFELNSKKYIKGLENFYDSNGKPVIKRGWKNFEKDEMIAKDGEKYEKFEQKKKMLKKDKTKDEKQIKTNKMKIDMITKQLNKIRLNKKESKVLIRPNFFKYCAKGKKYIFKAFNTPMDYVQDILDMIPPKNRAKKIDITEIVPEPKFEKVNRHQIKTIKDICLLHKKRIDELYNDDKLEDKERYFKEQDINRQAIGKLKIIKPNTNTLTGIIYRIYSDNPNVLDEELINIKSRCFGWIYKAYDKLFMDCFYKSKGEVSQIAKTTDEKYDFEIFGEKFKEVYINLKL